MKNLLLAVVCLVVACGFYSCKVQSAAGAYMPAEGEKPAKEVLVEKERPAPKVEAELEVAAAVEVVEEAEPEPVVEQPAEKEITRAEVFSVVEGESDDELKKYHVVIGSFKKQDNAKRLQERMRPEYRPVIVINEHGMYRVLLVSYDEYAAAKQKINAIRAQFADAWVLVQKQ